MSENVSQKASFDPIRAFLFLSTALLAVVAIGIVILVVEEVTSAPERARRLDLKETTCKSNGMILLRDKYHADVCAFKLDDEGNRIP